MNIFLFIQRMIYFWEILILIEYFISTWILFSFFFSIFHFWFLNVNLLFLFLYGGHHPERLGNQLMLPPISHDIKILSTRGVPAFRHYDIASERK